MKKALALAAVALAAALLGWWLLRGDAAEQQPAYRVAPIRRGALVQTVDTTGTLEARRTVEVGTQVSGVIDALLVDFNDEVQPGQVLARLETDALEARLAQEEAGLAAARAAVERAQVTLDEARSQLDRTERLLARAIVKAEELEAAQFAVRGAEASQRAEGTRVAQAEAAVRMARTNLEHCTITSPIHGVVLDRAVDVGQTVAASLQAPKLFTLAEDLSRMLVEANVDEADIGQVTSGLPVSFSVDAFPRRRFEGAITQVRLSPTVTQNVVTYTVIIATENPDGVLLPGMTANVGIEVQRVDDALIVPAAALRFRPQDGAPEAAAVRPTGRGRTERVYVLQGGRPTPVEVRLLFVQGAEAAVEGDLPADAEVVVGVEAGARRGAASPMGLLRGNRR